MPAVCCVVGCGSRWRWDRDNVRFFRIPSVTNFKYRADLHNLSLKRRQAWLSAIRGQDFSEAKQKSARICSKHFISGFPAALKDSSDPDWIPTLKMGYEEEQQILSETSNMETEKPIECSNVNMENTPFINREDFDQICRCCLKKGPLTSMVDLMYEDISFAEIFLNVFGEQIDFFDELPKCVCDKCIAEIIHCYDFKKSYYDSSKTLAIIIANSTSRTTTAEESGPTKNIEEILLPEEPKIIDSDDFTRNEDTEDALDEEENVKHEEKTATNLVKDEDLDIKEETNIISDLQYEDIPEIVNENNISKTYSCEHCPNEKFNNPSTLWSHTLSKHQKNKRNTCNICNASFMKRATLQAHKRIHFTDAQNENSDSKKIEEYKPNPELKTYKCPVCPKTFIFMYQLTKHKREENHKPPAKIPCEICKKLISRSCKNDHLRLCQSSEKPMEKPHVCEYCGIAFNYKSNFLRHLMRHTGKRPYVCETCGKGFIQKGSLVHHERLHTGEKPFLCDYCGETFRLQESYRSHLIKSHPNKSSGENSKERVQCKICDKFCSTKAALKAHMTLHNTGIFSEPIVARISLQDAFYNHTW